MFPLCDGATGHASGERMPPSLDSQRLPAAHITHIIGGAATTSHECHDAVKKHASACIKTTEWNVQFAHAAEQ